MVRQAGCAAGVTADGPRAAERKKLMKAEARLRAEIEAQGFVRGAGAEEPPAR